MGCPGPILAGLVATSQQTLITRLKAATPQIKLTSGVLLTGVWRIVILRLYAGAQCTAQPPYMVSKTKFARVQLLMLVGTFHIYGAINVGLFTRLLFP